MKYWILTTEFPPFHGGGISTYCLHTGLMLAERGHEVSVFVSENSSGKKIQSENFRGINVIRFTPKPKEHYSCLGYTSALSFQFAEIVIDHIQQYGAPDFIETQDYHGIGYYLMLRKKIGEEVLQNVKLLLTAHAPSFFYLRHNQAPVYALPDYWTGEMEKWTMKAADLFISPSHYLVNTISTELGPCKDDYRVIRNPYKIITDKTVKRKFTKGDIVFFGKLTYQKGCLSLLKYMSELWDGGFDHTLNFIGGDHYFEPKQTSMQEYLKKRFKRHFDNGKFSFEGKMSPEQLNTRLAVAQLIIVPSIVDNFPYAVVESMLLGKVLLVSDGGGQAEMIEDGKSGFIYEQTNFNSFKKKLTTALSLSPEAYEQIGDNAKKRISEMCDYETVYTEKMKVLNLDSGNRNSDCFPFIHDIAKTNINQEITVEPGKLSIVIPYYNTGKYLAEAIESAEKSDYANKEIIVVNDGSDDPQSIAVLYKLQEKYGFTIVTQTNKGLAMARNAGVKSATGEYIAFLDADDKIQEQFYYRAIQLLKKYKNLSFVSSWVEYFDNAQGIWPAQNPEPPFILLHNTVNAGFLCRRSDYYNFALNDEAFEYGMEDYDANLSLLENGCRGIVIPEPLYYYRVHSSSMARGFNKFNQLYLYRILSHKHKILYEKYAPEVFNLLLANGPSYLYDNPTLAPATDILEMRKWTNELEHANLWYRNKLSHLENQTQDANLPPVLPQGVELPYSNTVNSPYHQIKDWYHKEYEVLPLWYKRMGHIIKVFQGHRTLKSLFTENQEAV